eukprot:6172419-Pleurochrysis_carterae.AAC.5
MATLEHPFEAKNFPSLAQKILNVALGRPRARSRAIRLHNCDYATRASPRSAAMRTDTLNALFMYCSMRYAQMHKPAWAPSLNEQRRSQLAFIFLDALQGVPFYPP